eukprot:scaffold28477_cov21-Tisochrysis_lutea.AAC.3
MLTYPSTHPPVMFVREKCAWSSALTLVCGSVNFALSTCDRVCGIWQAGLCLHAIADKGADVGLTAH